MPEHQNIKHLEETSYSPVTKILVGLLFLLLLAFTVLAFSRSHYISRNIELEKQMELLWEENASLNEWADEVEWQRDSLQVELDEYSGNISDLLYGYNIELFMTDEHTHVQVFVEQVLDFHPDNTNEAVEAMNEIRAVLQKYIPKDPEVYEGSARENNY